jgi:hypothetical protein
LDLLLAYVAAEYFLPFSDPKARRFEGAVANGAFDWLPIGRTPQRATLVLATLDIF